MNTLYIITFFILGLVFGSFYNVLGYRLPKGESIVFPPSHCTKCNHRLSFFELIPVFSYLFLGGRCKHCKEKISPFYPVIELACGILFAVSFYSFHFSFDLIISLVLVSMLMIIVVSDLNFMIISDEVLVASSLIIVVTKMLSLGFIDTLKSIGCGLLLFGIMYFIMFMGNIIFKKESLGGGDIKLMFVGGLVLHPIIGIFSIFLASLFALVPSIYLLIKNEEHVIPFGPFLMFSIMILFLMKISTTDIQNIVNMLLLIR